MGDPTHTASDNGQVETEGDEISLIDASHIYAGEWMIMRITSHDQYGSADGGIIIAHDKSKKALKALFDEEIDRAERTGSTVGLVFGHQWLRPGEGCPSIIDELLAKAEVRDTAKG